MCPPMRPPGSPFKGGFTKNRAVWREPETPYVGDPLKRFPYVRCFSCNQMGHYAANCTNTSVSSGQKPKGGKGGGGDGARGPGRGGGGRDENRKGSGGPPPGPRQIRPPKVHPVGGSAPPCPPTALGGPEGLRGAGPLLGSSQPPCMA